MLINFLKQSIAGVIVLGVFIFLGGGFLNAAPPEQPPGLSVAMEVQDAHTPF